MIRLGRDELNGAPHLSIDERLARLDAVSATEVVTVARAVLRSRRVMGVVGPFQQGDLDRWVA
jgi:predicted Zn-dependent peptidase